MNLKSIFKHYLKFLRKYSLSQIGILVFYGLSAVSTTVVVPLIYKEIVDVVSIRPPDVYDRLGALVIFLALVIFIYNIFFRAADYLIIHSQSRILKELFDYTLEKLKEHSYTFFSNVFVGGLVTKTKRFVHAFEVLHDQFIFHIWMNGITLLSSLVVLFYQNRLLGFAFLSWIALYAFLVRFMVKKQIPKSLANAKADTKTVSRYADIITNILTIKIFGSGFRELKNFKKITDEQEEKRRIAWMQEVFWNNTYQSIVIGIFNIAIIWLAIDLWKKGVIPAGTIVLVQVYVITSFHVVWTISRNIVRTSSALADADEMVKIFDRKIGVKDPANPKKLSVKSGEIRFNKVYFSYDKKNIIFEDLDLKIKPGEKVGLVGYSGAGKTTIVKLLLRFIDVQKGTITIDGQDITEVAQNDLHRQIAYVPQEPLLFHRTLRENIAYARPGALFKEVVGIAKKAQAHEFIEMFPNKYDTLVGERGIKLSGGERQRIAIARAMLKNAPIVVLDEATSSLDSIVEKKIQKALEELIKGKTTIVIAHRLSTIQKMDRIIVFFDGKIIETGTHKELTQKSGLYSKFWKNQVRGFSK